MRFNRFANAAPRGKNKFHPYKNQFEKDIHHAMPKADYENKSRKVSYTTDAIYNPDFTFKDKPWLLVEAKGRFMGGSKEAAKYVWVKKCHPKMEIVFIFEKPNNIAYPGCRRRKDGSVLTMGEWASKNEFAFFTNKHIPPEFINGTVTREFLESIKRDQHEMYFGS